MRLNAAEQSRRSLIFNETHHIVSGINKGVSYVKEIRQKENALEDKDFKDRT